MTHQCLNFKVLEVKEKMCITSYSLKFKDRWLGAYVDHNMPSPSMIYTKFVFHSWCHSSCAYSWHAIGRCTWSHVSRQHLNAPLLDYHKAMLPNQPWGHCTNFPRFTDTSKTCLLANSHIHIWQLVTQLNCGNTCWIWGCDPTIVVYLATCAKAVSQWPLLCFSVRGIIETLVYLSNITLIFGRCRHSIAAWDSSKYQLQIRILYVDDCIFGLYFHWYNLKLMVA